MGKKEIVKQCIQCNNSFIARKANTIFCNIKCWRIHNKDKVKNYYKELSDKGLHAYNGIKARCNRASHPDYVNYGAKGIKLLLSQEQFVVIYNRTDKCEKCGVLFSTDTGRNCGKNKKTIDRLDEDGHYEINNIRIICNSCNSKNKKDIFPVPSKEILIDLYINKEMTRKQIAEYFGVPEHIPPHWFTRVYKLRRKDFVKTI